VGVKGPPTVNMNASPSSRGRSIDSRFLRVTGAVVAIVGGVVFAGWALGIDWLIVLIPHSVPMKANTALGFVLSGCAIFLLPTRSERAKRAARVCATMVSGIALVTLVEYMSGWNLGIDEILFRATDPAVATSHPGRMSLNAVLGFALTAAALWLMSGPAGRARLPMILGWLGSLIAVIGLVAIFSYLVGFSFGYEWGKLAVMAIHTASLFVLIGAAVLCLAWREAGVVWMIGARLTMGIVGSLALIVVLAVYSNRSAKELVEAAARLRRTHESISKIHQLLSGLDEAQSAVRGFVITGNEDFLAPSGKAIPEAREYLRDLREDMLDNASQQARLAALEKLIAAYLEYSRETIDLRKTAGFDAAAQRIGTGRGNASMDEIRGRLREMEEEEERLLASRRALSIATTERTLAVLPFGVLLSVLVLALGVLRLNAEAAARQRAAEALWQSANRRLGAGSRHASGPSLAEARSNFRLLGAAA